MMEAFDTFTSLQLSSDMRAYIHLELRRPQGTEHLYELLRAIKSRKMIEFQYHKFWEEEASHRLVSPYALKEFRSRWYVVAWDLGGGGLKTFALDRMSALRLSARDFTMPPELDITAVFRYCYGVISDRNSMEQPEPIVLRFSAHQGKYIKTLPLHHSQQILEDNDEEFTISLQLHPSYDLVMEIMSFGDEVQVLSPVSLVEEIRDGHRRAYEAAL
jgi:hypothetical protein